MVQVMTTKKPRVSLYIDESVKTRLERLAKKRKRSLNNLIEVICEKELDEAEKLGELDDE